MRYNKIFSLIMALAASIASASAQSPNVEPESSAMAANTWVKVRVEADGVYQFSYDRLRELGFANPERVNIYGYQPLLLLTADNSVIPADLTPLQSLHENDKLLFYAMSNVDVTNEFWSDKLMDSNLHKSHSYSCGATYFLSDAPLSPKAIERISAPSQEYVESQNETLTSHSALIFHEKDVINMARGGSWFSDALITAESTEPYPLTVGKIKPGGNASFIWCTLISTGRGVNNNLVALYDNGVMSEEATAVNNSFTDSHQEFARLMRRQRIQFPERAEIGSFDFNVTFTKSVSSSISCSFSLDYFALLYDRMNNLSGESQMQMFIKPSGNAAAVSLSGMSDADDWHVWNATNPLDIKQYELLHRESDCIALVSGAGSGPARVVAFRSGIEQPEPEVIGEVSNQNLHAMPTPDVVVITSSTLINAGEAAAEYHRMRNGLTVEVVDQQQIFNEYGSGNTSPEAVRRFIRHLDSKASNKLQAVLIVGPATYNSPQLITPENPYVITYEVDDYRLSNYTTRNSATDAYFGAIGDPIAPSGSLWSDRTMMFRVFASGIKIPVGRLPFKSASEINSYYNKVDAYIAGTKELPLAGNLILASDYSSDNTENHMANAEAMKTALGDDAGTNITVTRCASNMYSIKNNLVNRRIMMSALSRGTLLSAYFGHGGIDQIGGMVSSHDYLMCETNLHSFNYPGRTPIFFLGSCNTASYDQYEKFLAADMILQEDGGSIVTLGSGREVYPDNNQELGQTFVRHLYGAASGSMLGQIWIDALNEAVTLRNQARDKICNFLSYSYLGDPLLPVLTATESIDFAVDDSEGRVFAGKSNRIIGTITDNEGNPNTDFNGTVKIYFYDVPEHFVNLNSQASSLKEVDEDHSIIGEYSVEVKAGQFELDFTGPYSAMTGSHRLQAFAYSTDGSARALGSVMNVAIEDNAEPKPDYSDFAAISISEFDIEGNRSYETMGSSVDFSARIIAPAGFEQETELIKPLRLSVDGVPHTSLMRHFTSIGNGEYRFDYTVSGLARGRHEVVLSVRDAAGNRDESTINFLVQAEAESHLTASIGDGGAVWFEFMSSLPSAIVKSHKLIVERLDGTTIVSKDVANFPHELTLEPGAYRAFVLQEGEAASTSSGKIELIVE